MHKQQKTQKLHATLDFKTHFQPGVVACTCNPRTWEDGVDDHKFKASQQQQKLTPLHSHSSEQAMSWGFCVHLSHLGLGLSSA